MYKCFFKRLLDFLFALVFIPLIIIPMAIVAFLIFRHDKGTVLFRSNRMGKNGRSFVMYKFRTMQVNAPDLRNADGSTFNSDSDSRVTRIGKFLRKTSIDELPQVFNVLKGDMSLVGPRPTLARSCLDGLSEMHLKRITVRPGITGYAQAYFRNSISQHDKFVADCFYVDNLSLWLDIRVIFMTFASVVLMRNINVTASKNIQPPPSC